MVLQNRRARRNYEIIKTFEAGIELTGSEIKSLREGGGSIAEAYARAHNNEIYLESMNIPVYKQASYNNHEPLRRRKLLLRRSEIVEIERALDRKGLTLVPLKLYLHKGWAKLSVALARGKKLYDKRQTDAKRDAQRQMDRALKNNY